MKAAYARSRSSAMATSSSSHRACRPGRRPDAMDMAAPRSTKTTCPYCGVGCGVIADVTADGGVSVRGDPDHPANFGRLCSKGAALAETVGLEDRLLFPQVEGARENWNAALDLVAARFRQAINEHGPDSVAFYVSGQ